MDTYYNRRKEDKLLNDRRSGDALRPYLNTYREWLMELDNKRRADLKKQESNHENIQS